MNENNDFALMRRPSSAVEKTALGAKRILSGMVADTLALVRKARPIRIVMVNDEDGPLRSFEVVIRHWFKDVTMLMFDNGSAALEELLQTDPDLLITDDRMAVMGGEVLCQRLFDRQVTYPIIVDSAWEPIEPEWVREFANRGLNISFLHVPCDVESILKAVKTALKIPRDAAAQLENWFQTGEKHYHGQGVPQNCNGAVKWYRKAAEQNHAEAQFNLGRCYDYGQGVTEDHTEAFKWYLKAAEQGHIKAQDCVGTYYYVGRGVKENYSEAVKWLRGLKKQTLGINQLWLGTCYEEGKGVPRDYCEAYKFYKLAVEAAAAGDGSVHEVIFEQNLKPLISRMTKQKIAEGERRHKEFCSSED